jgi:hypothetical protein
LFKYIGPEIPTKKSKVTLQKTTSSKLEPYYYNIKLYNPQKNKKTALSGLKPAIYKEISGSATPKDLQSSM